MQVPDNTGQHKPSFNKGFEVAGDVHILSIQ